MIGTNTQKLLRVALASDDAMNDVSNNFLSPNVMRLQAQQGTPLAAGNVALSSGFGTSPSSILTAGSTDTRGQIQVTVGTSPTANPTITITFADGTFGTAPFAIACYSGTSNALPLSVTTTATTMVIELVGTPSASEIINITWHVMG